ncbi:Ribosome-associated complex subunit [Venturia nashicola]|nr:Ribosome-associated complex subunit [Venturia nashicola]
MRTRYLTMILLLLVATLSASFSFNPLSLVDRNSTSFIPFIANSFSAPTTESYEPPSTVEELPEVILLYDAPAERTWSGMAMVNSSPLPTVTFVSEPALTAPVISSAAICEELAPHSLDRQSSKPIICAMIASAFLVYILWLLCCPCGKQRESKGTQTPMESKATQTEDIKNNLQSINRNGLQNSPRPNATKHSRLARLEREQEEFDHTQRCLARNGNAFNAEDLSKDALVRIVLKERAKHAEELELLKADNASLRHRPQITTTPPKPVQEDGKSREKLEEIKRSFKNDIEQIENEHATELNSLRKEISDLGVQLSISRGANTAQEVDVRKCGEYITEIHQEITQVIIALLWINQDSEYQLIPRLKTLLPNVPLEQFASAPCNNDAHFPLFKWVLHTALPNYTSRCPCGGSAGISSDHLHEQLSSIHPGPTTIMPNYGLSNGLNMNENTQQQPINGSTVDVAAPIGQKPLPYLGNGISPHGIPPQPYPVLGAVFPQITLPPPPQITHVPFPPLKPLPQPTTTTGAPPIAITGLDQLDDQPFHDDRPTKDELKPLRNRYR